MDLHAALFQNSISRDAGLSGPGLSATMTAESDFFGSNLYQLSFGQKESAWVGNHTLRDAPVYSEPEGSYSHIARQPDIHGDDMTIMPHQNTHNMTEWESAYGYPPPQPLPPPSSNYYMRDQYSSLDHFPQIPTYKHNQFYPPFDYNGPGPNQYRYAQPLTEQYIPPSSDNMYYPMTGGSSHQSKGQQIPYQLMYHSSPWSNPFNPSSGSRPSSLHNPGPTRLPQLSGIAKPKRGSGTRSHRRRHSSRNTEHEGGSMSMALLAPGISQGLQSDVPHVSEQPPGGYYWAVMLNRNLENFRFEFDDPQVDEIRSYNRRHPLRSSRRRNRQYNDDDNLLSRSGSTGDDGDNDENTFDPGIDDAVMDDDDDEYEEEGIEELDEEDDGKYVPTKRHTRGRSRTIQESRRQATKSEINEISNALSDQQNTIPIQMCQPPLCNVMPAYPHALDADPQPRTRKQSKYSAEQDKLILDLKSQNRPWVEIAKLANCHNHLAARNRYQVLIGQQGGGNFIWTNDDCAALQDSLDEGERMKWLFIAEELTRKLDQHFSIDMVHYKIASMFAEKPQAFGVLRTRDPTRGGAPFDRHELY